MFYSYIEEGGLTWMLPLVFLSFCSVALDLERCWYWIAYFYHSWGRSEIVEKLFHAPWQLAGAMKLCSQSYDTIVATLHEFLLHYENGPLAIAERKARLFAEQKSQESRRFLDLLGVIANIAGTLGLMGTVVGISMVFKSLSSEDSKGVALALSTAVYTTIAGIILFLLSYLPFFFFQKLSDRLDDALDVHIHKLNDFLELQEKSRIIFDTPSIASRSVPPKEKKTEPPQLASPRLEPPEAKISKEPVAKAVGQVTAMSAQSHHPGVLRHEERQKKQV